MSEAKESKKRPSFLLDPSYVVKTLKRKSVSLDLLDSADRNEAKVLVLYTGGTIGMIKNEQGVYAPLANELETRVKKYPQLHDEEYIRATFNQTEENESFLVLPETSEPRRVLYFICEYNPLLDSSNMTMDDYIAIAEDIQAFYSTYDGFVILHGTDTMAYTASALSFMLENLRKSVVITGAQIPLFEARSDGRENFLNSILIAGNYCIPEVSVFFNNKLFRGNRTSKVSSTSLDAFNSPNMSPLVEVGTSIRVDWRSVFRATAVEKFYVHAKLNRNVGLLRVFPSITTQTVKAFLNEPTEGVVLQTYGVGNCPSNRTDLLEELKKASGRGVLILNITQCATGNVSSNYETGKVLIDAGVVPGSDMTPEAALAKLSYVLSKDEWSSETKKAKLQENLRGELTIPRHFTLEDIEVVMAIGKYMKLSSSEEMDALKEVLYPSILDALAMNGDIDKLEILRRSGANLSSEDYDKRTPLHIASCEGNGRLIEYLLKNGANIHHRDRSNKTPLMNAIEYNKHEAIKLLKKAGAHFQIQPITLGDLMCNAARRGDLKTLESFVLAEANLSQTDINGQSALHMAIEYNHVECVQYLMENHVDTETKNIYGVTPREVAVRLKRHCIVQIIDLK